MSRPVYQLCGLSKVYTGPAEHLVVLDNLELTIAQADSLAILGGSGSGKSTLLHLLGTLDSPTSGTLLFHGRDLSSFSIQEKAVLRNQQLGFVFQFHHLLPEFTTLENVAMPGLIGGKSRGASEGLAAEALDLVGLRDKKGQRVNTLSGGERQRAAIARAIALKPVVLLADEPTGNVDEHTGDRIARLLRHLNVELGTTMVIVTHNLHLASFCARHMVLHEGRLHDSDPRGTVL